MRSVPAALSLQSRGKGKGSGRGDLAAAARGRGRGRGPAQGRFNPVPTTEQPGSTIKVLLRPTPAATTAGRGNTADGPNFVSHQRRPTEQPQIDPMDGRIANYVMVKKYPTEYAEPLRALALRIAGHAPGFVVELLDVLQVSMDVLMKEKQQLLYKVHALWAELAGSIQSLQLQVSLSKQGPFDELQLQSRSMGATIMFNDAAHLFESRKQTVILVNPDRGLRRCPEEHVGPRPRKAGDIETGQFLVLAVKRIAHPTVTRYLVRVLAIFTGETRALVAGPVLNEIVPNALLNSTQKIDLTIRWLEEILGSNELGQMLRIKIEIIAGPIDLHYNACAVGKGGQMPKPPLPDGEHCWWADGLCKHPIFGRQVFHTRAPSRKEVVIVENIEEGLAEKGFKQKGKPRKAHVPAKAPAMGPFDSRGPAKLRKIGCGPRTQRFAQIEMGTGEPLDTMTRIMGALKELFKRQPEEESSKLLQTRKRAQDYLAKAAAKADAQRYTEKVHEVLCKYIRILGSRAWCPTLLKLLLASHDEKTLVSLISGERPELLLKLLEHMQMLLSSALAGSLNKVQWKFNGALLGEGSFGSVHLVRAASEEAPEWLCAVCKVSNNADPHSKRCITAETDILELLSAEPDLPRGLMWSMAHGTAHELHFILLPPLRGPCLDDLIHSDWAPERSELWTLTADLLNTVKCLHAMGIAHFDIKPLNLCFDQQGAPNLTSVLVLFDFGLSVKLKEGMVIEHEPSGTPGYMAPEIFEQYVSNKVDIYPVCVTIFEMWVNDTYDQREGRGGVLLQQDKDDDAAVQGQPAHEPVNFRLWFTQHTTTLHHLPGTRGIIQDDIDRLKAIVRNGTASHFRMSAQALLDEATCWPDLEEMRAVKNEPLGYRFRDEAKYKDALHARVNFRIRLLQHQRRDQTMGTSADPPPMSDKDVAQISQRRTEELLKGEETNTYALLREHHLSNFLNSARESDNRYDYFSLNQQHRHFGSNRRVGAAVSSILPAGQKAIDGPSLAEEVRKMAKRDDCTLSEVCELLRRVPALPGTDDYTAADLYSGMGGASISATLPEYLEALQKDGIDAAKAVLQAKQNWKCGIDDVSFRFIAGVEKNGRRAMMYGFLTGVRAIVHEVTEEDPVPAGLDEALWFMHASPSCKPYAAEGKRLGATDPRDCIPGLLRAVERLQPVTLLIENVERFASYRETILNIAGSLKVHGYYVRIAEADDSLWYGVAQHHKHTFIVASKLGPISRPPRAVGPSLILQDVLPREAFSSCPSPDLLLAAALLQRLEDFERSTGVKRPRHLVEGLPSRAVTSTNVSDDTGTMLRIRLNNGAGVRRLTVEEILHIQGFPHAASLLNDKNTMRLMTLDGKNTTIRAIRKALGDALAPPHAKAWHEHIKSHVREFVYNLRSIVVKHGEALQSFFQGLPPSTAEWYRTLQQAERQQPVPQTETAPVPRAALASPPLPTPPPAPAVAPATTPTTNAEPQEPAHEQKPEEKPDTSGHHDLVVPHALSELAKSELRCRQRPGLRRDTSMRGAGGGCI